MLVVFIIICIIRYDISTICIYYNTFIIIDSIVSGDWLALQGSLNIFYRSSLGIESMLIGAYTISPQYRDSLSYNGYPFLNMNHPYTINEWHSKILYLLENDKNRIYSWLDKQSSNINNYILYHTTTYITNNETKRV